jgi:hypothetical protein
MPLATPHPVKIWIGTLLFFAVGVAVASFVALRMVESGSSVLNAIVVASFVGGYGAYFVFYAVLNAAKHSRGPRRSAGT